MLDDVNEVYLAMFAKQVAAGDMPGLFARSAEAEVVLTSQASVCDPLAANLVRTFLGLPVLFAGDVEGFGVGMLVNTLALRAAAESFPDLAIRHKCGQMAYGLPHMFDPMVLQPTFSWDAMFGKDGSMLSVASNYDYGNDHAVLNETQGGDFLNVFGGMCVPLAVHYGDMEMA